MSLQDIAGNYASDDDDDPNAMTLTQLIARGRALNTVKGYTNHLQRLYKKVLEYIQSLPQAERQHLPPYDNYHWLADRAAVRTRSRVADISFGQVQDS